MSNKDDHETLWIFVNLSIGLGISLLAAVFFLDWRLDTLEAQLPQKECHNETRFMTTPGNISQREFAILIDGAKTYYNEYQNQTLQIWEQEVCT